jgi:hypothetical protein
LPSALRTESPAVKSGACPFSEGRSGNQISS